MIVPLQIRFGDIDRLGHVNNSVYAQFFDLGRVEYLSLCMPHLGFTDQTLVLVHLETDFIVPVFGRDQIYVETILEKIGEKSVQMIQEIKDQDGQIRSRCKSVLSTLDMQSGTSFLMPEEWRKALSVKY